MASSSSHRLSMVLNHLSGGAPAPAPSDSSLCAAPCAASVSTTTQVASDAHSASSSASKKPVFGGGKGTLAVTDSRTAKTYQIEINQNGAIKATDFKNIKAGGDGAGVKVFDPGYVNTAACKSAISYIDGDKGILRYRGYPIEELAENSTYLESAYLLMYGSLPSKTQLHQWERAVMQHSALPQSVIDAVNSLPHDAHPMGVLLTGINALSLQHPEANPAISGQNVYNGRDKNEVRDKQIVRIIGKMSAIAALAYHRATGRTMPSPNVSLGYAENFLYMLDAHSGNVNYRPHPKLARALDIMFILHADHEMNCSTAAMRHLASSGVDVYTCVAGAVGALYGPLHGGANEAVLRMLMRIGSVDEVPRFLEGVKARREKLFGFGHRVYKNFDPRATIIRRVAEEVFQIVGRDPLIDVAKALQDAALSDDYFIKRKLYPNVDFYSGLVYRSLGFPPEYFTVLFAIPRAAGYLAHWRESLDDEDSRIVRPQQVYTGEWLRRYEAMDGRPQVAGGVDALSDMPMSNATRRRLVGSSVAK